MMNQRYHFRDLGRARRSKSLPLILVASFLFFLMLPALGQTWEVNPANFELSMNITAKVKLDGAFINQENSQLAAFVGDEIRGVVEPIYSGASNTLYYFLTVYSNQVEGEMISFKFRDENGQDTELLNQVAFFVDKILGKTTDPFIVMNPLEYSSTDFLEFSIPNQIIETAIDTDLKTIYVGMPTGSDLRQLIPYFSLEVGANTYVNNQLQESEVSVQDFSFPVTYRVIGVDNASVDWIVYVSNEVSYVLSYEAGAGGSISGEASQNVFHNENGTPVEAIPDANYHFVKWSDGVLDNPRTDMNVTANISVIAEFSLGAYTLTYLAGTGGSISGEANQELVHGEDGTSVEAVPDAGFHFVKWSDDSIDNPRVDLNVTANISVTAEFSDANVLLHYEAGIGGSITGDIDQEVIYGEDGTAVEAIADAGYYFLKWSDDVTDNPRTDLNVVANVSVTAEFVIFSYNLTYSVGTGGSIVGDLSQVVNYGEDGTSVEAIPDAGYHFIKWSDDVTDNPRTDLNVTADISVRAEFLIYSYLLNYAAGDGGTLSGDLEQEVNYGDDGTAVEAIPDAGYHFVKWSDDVTDNPRTDLNITYDISVTAEFATGAYTLSYLAGTGGTLSGEANQEVLHGEDGTAVEAIPDLGYYFVKWSDGSTENPRTDIYIATNISVTAEFSNAKILLHYEAGIGGSITGNLDQEVNYGEDGTAVEAIPDAGYYFVKWSDDVTDNPRTDLNVRSDISVSAQFVKYTYSLNYSAGSRGSLVGDLEQEVAYGEDGSSIEAVPDYAYHFVKWSDDSTDNPRTDLNITANLSVTAEFSVGGYWLTYRAGEGGTLLGNLNQEVIYKENGRAVQAVPDAGYYFVKWSDDTTDNPRTDLNIIADISVSAEFDLIPGLINSFSSKVSLYPNPVKEVLFIDLGLVLSKAQLRLINITGQVIQEQLYVNQQIIEVYINQPAGVYLITIESEDLSLRRWIIKN